MKACTAQAEREMRDAQTQLQELAAQLRDEQSRNREEEASVAENTANAREAARNAESAKLTYALAAQAARVLPLQTSQASDEGWLGIEIGEVTAQKAKDLRLSSERGVVVASVEPGSPAAKAGLKQNDVITQYDGESVEGTEQFRRLVRETPPNRTATLTISREGRSQNLSVQLGDSAQAGRQQFQRAFRGMDNVRLAMPPQEWSVYPPSKMVLFESRTPILGITAEDLSGQLGAYFGAPHDEGVLVRDVVARSPSEKAGVKAGDVIISANGKPIHSLADLRGQLPPRPAEKAVDLTLGLLRKGSQMNVTVTIEPPQRPEPPPALHSAQL